MRALRISLRGPSEIIENPSIAERGVILPDRNSDRDVIRASVNCDRGVMRP